MRECRLEDDNILITVLVKYHDDLRERDPERTRQAWTRAKNLAAENELTIDDAVPYRF